MKHIIDCMPYNWALLLTIIGEIFLPCILKYFYKGYDAKKMVMSALGSLESPVRKVYNMWLIWLGIFLSFTSILYFIKARAGALMALGLKYGQTEIEDLESRWKTNDITSEFLELFCEENGSNLCKELLGCDLGTPEGIDYAKTHNLFTEFCPTMVVSATKIAEQLMNR